MLLAALALMGGVGLAVAALMVLTGEPIDEVVQADLPVLGLDQHEDLALPEEPGLPTDEAGATEASVPTERPVVPESTAAAGRAPAAAPQTADSTAAVEAIRERGPGVVRAPTSLDDLSGPIGSPASRTPEAIVLQDAAEIDAMVAGVLAAKDATLRQCYESRLKEREDLLGAWRIALTVSRGGQPQGVSVRPLGMSDELLEDCLERNVSNWRFQRIAEEVEVVKSYRFGPGF